MEAAKRLAVTHILSGSFVRAKGEFILNWQLLDVKSNTVKAGDTLSVVALDLVAIQNSVCEQVFASLQRIWPVDLKHTPCTTLFG